MADTASRDQNRNVTIQAISNADQRSPVNLWADPSTHKLLVDVTLTPVTTQDVNLTQVGGASIALGQAAAASSLPVVLTAAQITTLTPLSTIAATQSGTWNIGTVATITNPVAVTGTFWQATQPISGTVTANIGTIGTIATEATLSALNTKIPSGLTVTSTRLLVDGSGVTQPVSGTFWQATQPVSGTFWQATQPISAAALPLPALAATSTKQSDGSQKTQVVDGSGNVIGSTSNALDVNIKSGNPATPTTLVAFRTDIPTAGTRVQLASNAVSGVVIQAPSTNTGVIYVGGATVSSTVCGAELQPGQSTGLAIDNTNKIYVDTATNGNDVMILGS